MKFNNHISAQFNAELERSMSDVIEMAGLTEKQLKDALRAMTTGDETLANEVIKHDKLINQLEVDINERCITIIAKGQPTASDLRLLIVIIKTITELERIADASRNIARMAFEPLPAHLKPVTTSLENLAKNCIQFFEEVMDAFARMDSEAVLNIYAKDDKIDDEYDSIIRQLITYMMENSSNIPPVLLAMRCARSLERIGDRSQNICEFIIYFAKGVDIRVKKNEKIQALLNETDYKAL